MKPENYERRAAAYDFFNLPELKPPRIQRVIAHAARLLAPGAMVCDAGGGTGIHAEQLLKLGPDVSVTLVDLASDVLAISRRGLGGRVRYLQATIQEALSRIEPQDAFIFIRSLYAMADTVDDYDHLFRRIRAVLRDDGLLCVYEVHHPVDVDAARDHYAAACTAPGLQEQFEQHWGAFAEYLREANGLLQARRVGILDHRRRDALLLQLGFHKIHLSPAVSLHRKPAGRDTLNIRDDLREFILIQDGEGPVLLNVELSAVFRISPSLGHALENRRGEPGAAVTEPGLIDALRKLELVREHPRPSPGEVPRPGVGHLMLNICQDCNLACVYCYGGEGEYGHRSRMTRETARAAVDWLIQHSQGLETIQISFFGGEPLLDFELVKFVIEYARPRALCHGKTVRFSMTTNATLLTKEMARYLRAAAVRLQISYDGALHDAQRPYKDGTGTSAAVREAIGLVARLYDGDFKIISTIARPEIDLAGLRRELRDLGCERMHIRQASPLFAGCGGGCETDPAELREPLLSDGLIQKFDADLEVLLQENLIRNQKRQEIVGNDFRKILSLLLFRGKLTHFCGAGRGLLAVAANGDIYPCHRFNGQEEFRMGRVSGLDPHARDRYDGISVDSTPDCRECWARYLCGGGCLYDTLNNPRRDPQPYAAGCELFRNTARTAIRLFARLSPDDREFLKQKLGPPQAGEPVLW